MSGVGQVLKKELPYIMSLELCVTAEVKFGSLISVNWSWKCACCSFGVLFLLFCLFSPPPRIPTSIPTHTFLCKQDSIYLKGFLLHIQIPFLILSKLIPCKDGSYLKQPDEIKISHHFCSSVTAQWEFARWLLSKEVVVFQRTLGRLWSAALHQQTPWFISVADKKRLPDWDKMDLPSYFTSVSSRIDETLHGKLI